MLLLSFILLSGVSLILVRVDHAHLDARLVMRGVGLAILAGVIVAHSFFFLSKLSRDIDPFAAAYFWETGVGIVLTVIFLLRNRFKPRAYEMVRYKDAMRIMVISLLTIVGTATYASAATYGPYALVSGLMSMTTLISVVMGWYLYKEGITTLQGVLIGFSIVCVVTLKILS